MENNIGCCLKQIGNLFKQSPMLFKKIADLFLPHRNKMMPRLKGRFLRP